MSPPTDRRLVALDDEVPEVDPSAWIAPGAHVVGGVRLGREVGIYYGAVLRAEVATITVGDESNIQDNCVVHAGLEHSVVIGSRVTVGHAAVIHGCTVEDEVLVGMGATLLNGCVIGTGSVIGAGALVPQGAVVPPGSLVVGTPARVVRPLTEDERSAIRAGAEHYVDLLPRHRRATAGTGEGETGDQQDPHA
ncbi:carbonic anhydrase/acetyltransferase-like protein (isoleucine patch superfamily) [Nocardioides cavernae]|uniref:Carbonic anhydrase/acetyltransferase-like protein (Isoleucine patch superfamily) n=1 Tax=Nocardioides cavernae TaxID=1921566 RepID=A0A7Y9H0Z4_9ACTN|nr:gamma carbonic anhydrase family protein [Nocardioides cavernae]NYE35805.1 carbonic anhydrase/acetyltransferase-like protein (isoleucine patch superfamily) [Nocardioides cavernae]